MRFCIKKSQAALEFLTTYGWAFLVILIALGALSYFGILSPSKFLPERCTVGPEFECQKAQIDTTQNSIRLRLKSNADKAITISSMSLATEGSTALSCSTMATGSTYSSSYWTQSGLVAYSGAGVNDGDTGSATFHTDSSAAGSYLQLDLGVGNAKPMKSLSIWTTGNINQFIWAIWDIQYSDDASAWTTVYSGFGPFNAPPTPQPYTATWASAGMHRYWRLLKTNPAAGGGYHNEVQFYDTNLLTWKPGQTADLVWSGCNNVDAGFAKGEKGKVLVSIKYYDVLSGSSFTKEVKGEFISNPI